MIAQVFPKDFPRYLSLPILGSVMDSFAAWLHEQQYTWRSSQYELRMAARICGYLKRRAVLRVEDITEQDLQSCHRLFRRKYHNEAGSVSVLARYLFEHGWVKRSAVPPPSRNDVQLNAFAAHLRDACGHVPATIKREVSVATEFLVWLNFKKAPERLISLSAEDIDGFVRRLGKRMGRAGLQSSIGAIRNFLRFLAAEGAVAPGLDKQIDTPRLYRQEQLPRALPWPTVQALLRSIDRNQAIGKRDYAIFSLMATYGLRACDVAALTLEAIQWRAGQIRICQSKTGQALRLPLTDEVYSALCDYLQNVPRYGAYRHVFLRLKAPGGVLKSTGVIEAFQAWSGRSGLDIPFKGAHCIRHAYAMHLLRQGESLKTIGDLLGHKSPESTATYLRLATEDLRDVALPVPSVAKRQKGEGRDC